MKYKLILDDHGDDSYSLKIEEKEPADQKNVGIGIRINLHEEDTLKGIVDRLKNATSVLDRLAD